MTKTKAPDPKLDALRQHGSLNPHPERVSDPLFAAADFFDARDLVQVKYEMLRRVRVEGHSVGPSAAAFGFSRPSFYQAQAALQRGGLAGLVPKKPGPRRAHKLSTEVVDFLQRAVSQERLAALGGVGRSSPAALRAPGPSAQHRAGAGSPGKKTAVSTRPRSATTPRARWRPTRSCAATCWPAPPPVATPGWCCCCAKAWPPGWRGAWRARARPPWRRTSDR